jgi:hypothetical protein
VKNHGIRPANNGEKSHYLGWMVQHHPRARNFRPWHGLGILFHPAIHDRRGFFYHDCGAITNTNVVILDNNSKHPSNTIVFHGPNRMREDKSR